MLKKSFIKMSMGGYLPKDPEIKELPSGMVVCDFSLPHNYSTKTEKLTQWYNFKAFAELAAHIAANYKAKDWIEVAEIEYIRLWKDKGGQTRSHVVISALNEDYGDSEYGMPIPQGDDYDDIPI